MINSLFHQWNWMQNNRHFGFAKEKTCLSSLVYNQHININIKDNYFAHQWITYIFLKARGYMYGSERRWNSICRLKNATFTDAWFFYRRIKNRFIISACILILFFLNLWIIFARCRNRQLDSFFIFSKTKRRIRSKMHNYIHRGIVYLYLEYDDEWIIQRKFLNLWYIINAQIYSI